MPNLEFDVPMTIVSPRSTLDLNNVAVNASGQWWKVLPDSYAIVPTMRFVQDNVSQQDGSVLHPRFLSGQVATFKIQYEIAVTAPNFTPACETDLIEMHEALILAVNSLRQNGATPGTTQRYTWDASNGTTRALTRVLLLGWPAPTWNDSVDCWQVQLSLETPFPYAIDLNQSDLPVTDGGGDVLIPNAGDAEFWPVMEVAGPFSTFTITNDDSGEAVVYNGAGIGGSDHIELDFFNGTAYLNGDSTDEIDGIDPTNTDWFTIKPGGTNVKITGADMDVLSNSAYA